MAYHECAQGAAESEENESIFVLGMIGVGDQNRLLVKKDSPRLLERYPVLAPVLRVLSLVPLKMKLGHASSMYLQCNGASTPKRGRQLHQPLRAMPRRSTGSPLGPQNLHFGQENLHFGAILLTFL